MKTKLILLTTLISGAQMLSGATEKPAKQKPLVQFAILLDTSSSFR